MKPCLGIGESLLPDLLRDLDAEKRTPPFYLNIIVLACSIAPEHPKVKEILQNAFIDQRASVRHYASIALRDHPAPWVIERIQKLSKEDPEASIRQMADQLLKRWTDLGNGP